MAFQNEAEIEGIVAGTELLIFVLAQPDAEPARDGVHCLIGSSKTRPVISEAVSWRVDDEAPAPIPREGATGSGWRRMPAG
ncbi:hypothetical protein QA640_23505 [Bradyrhizobium sp. CB82]|uniref:hypothetical protein n=1 Tax=Bradyrhizobium sp. CB82 TaxID=3039159 RepID=UPI0024B07F5B|nr:hypothetical protein [Bradyrhizobium sp. CB82]WFU37450.1 hypothetical protein QA640_23505 [Bradyrhizobium sp. CB82]